MKKSDAFGLLFSSDRKENQNSQNVRNSAMRRATTLFTPSSLSAERNYGFPSASKSSSSRKTISNVSNKEFQHTATAKIRNYFRRQPAFDSFPVYGQQPLSTKGFIEMVDFLFYKLFKSSTITQQNYLEKIPIFMKMLGYQGHLQKSWLQVVNTASALAHVTSLLAFLVDLVDRQDDGLTLDFMFPPPGDGDDDDETNILKNCLALVLDSFEHWNKCGDDDSNSTREKEEMDKFARKLIEELNVSEDDIRLIEKDIASLESELNEKTYVYLLNEVEETQNICNSLQKDEETISLDLKKNHEFVRNLERDRNEKEQKVKSLEQFYIKKKNEVIALKLQCANQKLNVEERQNIIQKCNELKDSIKCYEDYLGSVKETIYKGEIEIAQLRHEVNNSCLTYNKLLMEPANQFEEIKHVRLPPNIFQYEPEAVDFGHVLRTILNESELKKSELEGKLKSVESKSCEVEGKLRSIINEIKEREIENTPLKDQLRIQREELNELRKELAKNEQEVLTDLSNMTKVLASCKETEQQLNNLKKQNEEKAVLIKNAEKERQAIVDRFTLKGYLLLNRFMERCHKVMDSAYKDDQNSVEEC